MSSSASQTPCVIFQVVLSIEPTETEAFLHHLRAVYEFIKAEPECISVYVTTMPDEAGVFRCYEGWTKDREWLTTHQLTKAYYIPYAEATQKLWAKPPVLEFLNPVPGFPNSLI